MRLPVKLAMLGTAAAVALAPPSPASEREDFRRYVNATPGRVTCHLWGQGGGQPSLHPMAEWIGGDCFGIADGETEARFELRDDRRWPVHFTLRFHDKGSHPIGAATSHCGSTGWLDVPDGAYYVEVALPPSAPSSLAGCWTATSGFMVAWLR